MLDPKLEEAKPAVDGFELPCGFIDEDGNLHTSVVVREMTGEEEEILAARNMPNTKKYNKLLARCTTSIGDFEAPREVSAIIHELPQGDRIYLLFAIRRASLGDEMPFTTKCPACDEESHMTIDLSEMEITKMPDQMVRSYETELPSGKKAMMKVLTGRGEEMIAKALKRGKDVITVAILARTESIEGSPVTPADLKKLGLRDRNHLKDVWEDYEGGVETEFDVLCPHCDNEYKADVEVGATGFFNPSAASRAWKKKSSI